MQRQEKQQVYICTRYKFEPHPKNSYDFSCAIYDDKCATVGHFKKMIKTILAHLMLFSILTSQLERLKFALYK